MKDQKVQVIMLKTAEEKNSDAAAWEDTKKVSHDAMKMAAEIQVLLDELGPKVKSFNQKVSEAYMKCPKKDAMLNVSPLGPNQILYGMKSYMLKTGFRIDGIHIGDPSTIPSFKEVVKEGFAWLLKFNVKGE